MFIWTWRRREGGHCGDYGWEVIKSRCASKPSYWLGSLYLSQAPRSKTGGHYCSIHTRETDGQPKYIITLGFICGFNLCGSYCINSKSERGQKKLILEWRASRVIDGKKHKPLMGCSIHASTRSLWPSSHCTTLAPDWNISTTVAWLVLQFSTCICGLQRMKGNDLLPPSLPSIVQQAVQYCQLHYERSHSANIDYAWLSVIKWASFTLKLHWQSK